MSDFDKGYIAYSWLEESGLESVANGCLNPDDFKRGYWKADNEMLQAKEDQERHMIDD